MAHYIADSGTPMHTLYDFTWGSPHFVYGSRSKTHFDWEKWIGSNTNFDRIANMPSNILYAMEADVLLLAANLQRKDSERINADFNSCTYIFH